MGGFLATEFGALVPKLEVLDIAGVYVDGGDGCPQRDLNDFLAALPRLRALLCREGMDGMCARRLSLRPRPSLDTLEYVGINSDDQTADECVVGLVGRRKLTILLT